MARVVVLGCGLMGRVIAEDLARDGAHDVVVVDRDQGAGQALAEVAGLRFERLDVSDIGRPGGLVSGADLVVGALPGLLGFSVLRRLVEAGCRRVVDISFMPEDPRLLAASLPPESSYLVDAGVAPGLSHMLASMLLSRLDEPERLRILVGGLPMERRLPYEYVTVFSPRDVLEEYTRPARIRWAGRVETRPALSEVELVDVPGVGTLEAFLTDGLRSLLSTESVPFMEEKTLRYPGHAALMRALVQTGFLSDEPTELPGGLVVRPVDLSDRLLQRAWRPLPGDLDMTVLLVEVHGRKAGVPVRLRASLVDRAQPGGPTSMARCTGYTAASVARLVLRGGWDGRGIVFPEELGKSASAMEMLLADLESRGMKVLFEAHESAD